MHRAAHVPIRMVWDFCFKGKSVISVKKGRKGKLEFSRRKSMVQIFNSSKSHYFHPLCFTYKSSVLWPYLFKGKKKKTMVIAFTLRRKCPVSSTFLSLPPQGIMLFPLRRKPCICRHHEPLRKVPKLSIKCAAI